MLKAFEATLWRDIKLKTKNGLALLSSRPINVALLFNLFLNFRFEKLRKIVEILCNRDPQY